MEISHSSKRLHLGAGIETLEFCPSERSAPPITFSYLFMEKFLIPLVSLC
jgi:hypothetical protein